MPTKPTVIGPFVGGLNTYSDETSVADNELVRCENFELDLDGSLKSRPPYVDKGVTLPLGASGNIELLGYYYAQGGITYLVGSDGLSSTYYFSGASWVLITNKISATALGQFDGKAWLLAGVGAANPGGYWTPTGGFVEQPNMPRGEVIVSHKARLWVAAGKNATTNSTRLYFSKVLGVDPFWTASPDFIDIGSGDGQSIVQLSIYFSSILIFRTESIYSYQFSADPASGIVSLVVPGIGLTDKDALVSHESFLYFMFEGAAYEFYNNRASKINTKVPFESVTKFGIYKPFSVSVFGSRVIFGYYDTQYVYSLTTKTWTTWVSPSIGPVGKIYSTDMAGQDAVGVTHSIRFQAPGVGRTAKTLFITDGLTDDSEPMQCIMQTKNYNYEASSVYKRLFWWGVDAVFRTKVTAIATPIVYGYTVTWSQLRQYTWGQLRDFSWGQPMSGTLAVETIRDTTGSGAMRKFVKLRKGLRFRQINYRLIFETDGSSKSAPVRVFSLTTYVSAKERVVKAVT